MRLYTPGLPTDYARHVIDQGFVGLRRPVSDAEELDAAATRDTPEGDITPPEKLPEPTHVAECCEFRDRPPGGVASSRTTESEIAQTGETELKMTIDGGPSLLNDPGDLVLSIEVPDSVALANQIHEEPPWGRPFREFSLTPGEANRYRDTLEIIGSNDGEEVQPDLRGWQDVPSQAPGPAVNQVEDDTANSPPSTRRSRRCRHRSRKSRSSQKKGR
jgi:hypothetical protein